MLYLHHGDRPSRVEPLAGLPDRGAIASAVWIDLDQPGGDEVALVEAALGIELPTAEDLYEIEASSRAYRDNGASYMTAVVVAGMDSGTPVSAPIGFVLAPAGQLVTLRLTSPKAFQTARQLATRAPVGPSGRAVMLRLLDLIVDRAADVLEMLGARIDETSAAIFGRADPPDRRLSPQALQNLLHAIGNNQYALNKVHESLQTLSRVVSFLTATMAENGKPDRGDRDALRSLARDIASLTENSTYLMQNVFFLLDAAVGRISIEQNVIIKILSFASIVLMPPTLIAGVYGMNFAVMPELHHRFGYPAALFLMLLSALLPLWYCRRKGWL